MKSRKYLVNPAYSVRKRRGKAVLVDRNGNAVSPLNESACSILKHANGKLTKDGIVAALLKTFEGNRRQITASIQAFLNEHARSGLIIKGDYQDDNKCFLSADISLPEGRRFIPESVCFGVTGKCNLRCKHCLAQNTWTTADIPTGKMLSLIDELGYAGLKNVSIFGGEPLVRKDLFLLLERFNRYPVSMTMNTNATLMTVEIVRTLIKRFKITGYTVSLDGTKEVHERQRGKGTYDRTIEGIEHIRRGGGAALLSFTVTKLNIGDLEETVRLGKELGMSQVRFNHVFYGGNAACYLEDVYVSPSEESDALQRIYKLSRKYPGFITGSYPQQYEKMQNLGKEKPVSGFVRVPPCGAATNKCSIRPDGWVTPCEIIWDVKAGNIHRQKFIDIWNNATVMQSFRKMMYVDVAAMPGCSNCEYQFMCFWGHRCTPYYYPGGIQNRSLYCWKMKRKKNSLKK